MNFQDLFKGWRGHGILSNTLDAFVEMLNNTHWMFQRAATALWEESDVEEYCLVRSFDAKK